MKPADFLSRLAVCSWSLQPESPVHLVEQLRAIGLGQVQLDLDPLRDQPETWGAAPELFGRQGIRVVSGMFRSVGEDYTSLESIRRTGGLVPDSTWADNWRNAKATARIAQSLGLDFVMFHAGFLPHDPADASFERLIGRVREVARLFADHGLRLGCETGQESGSALWTFLEHLGEANVVVNFDPANMILYNNGDPIEALRVVGSRVGGVHLKDARLTRVPGTWGEETAVGAGEVEWSRFFEVLAEARFAGWLCFEREAGDQRAADIRQGRVFVEQLLTAG
jgi:L-ribulose-5-phosphate 3-epimerase